MTTGKQPYPSKRVLVAGRISNRELPLGPHADRTVVRVWEAAAVDWRHEGELLQARHLVPQEGRAAAVFRDQIDAVALECVIQQLAVAMGVPLPPVRGFSR